MVNGDFNYNSFDRKASWQNQSFDFNGNNWSSEITSKFKFPKDLDLEMSWNYQSGLKTIDGGVGSKPVFEFRSANKITRR